MTAHGIRKHRGAVFKENGASADKRLAIPGHGTEAEAEAARYSKLNRPGFIGDL